MSNPPSSSPPARVKSNRPKPKPNLKKPSPPPSPQHAEIEERTSTSSLVPPPPAEAAHGQASSSSTRAVERDQSPDPFASYETDEPSAKVRGKKRASGDLNVFDGDAGGSSPGYGERPSKKKAKVVKEKVPKPAASKRRKSSTSGETGESSGVPKEGRKKSDKAVGDVSGKAVMASQIADSDEDEDVARLPENQTARIPSPAPEEGADGPATRGRSRSTSFSSRSKSRSPVKKPSAASAQPSSSHATTTTTTTKKKRARAKKALSPSPPPAPQEVINLPDSDDEDEQDGQPLAPRRKRMAHFSEDDDELASGLGSDTSVDDGFDTVSESHPDPPGGRRLRARRRTDIGSDHGEDTPSSSKRPNPPIKSGNSRVAALAKRKRDSQAASEREARNSSSRVVDHLAQLRHMGVLPQAVLDKVGNAWARGTRGDSSED